MDAQTQIYKITLDDLYGKEWENSRPQINGNHKVRDLNFNNLSIDKEVWQGTKGKTNHVTIQLFKPFKARTRFYILILVLLCLASIWSNILAFNFAVICIPSKEKSSIDLDISSEKNETSDEEDEEGIFTNNQNNYLTMAVAIGALIANFPAVLLANRFGIRIVFPIFGILSSVSTALMPLAIMQGFLVALVARFIQGVAFACNFPVIGVFTSKWTYFKQNGLFVSTLVAFVQFSPILTNPISGALCTSSLGWQSVFYGHSLCSLVLFILFYFLYRNTPAKHPLVGRTESGKIAIGKSVNLKAASKNIPYLNILKTASVWAVWIAAIGNFYCVNLVFLYQPTYLKKVLGFGVEETGITAAFPPLLQFGLKLLSGFISDKIHFIPETIKIKIFNSLAFCGAALFLVILGFIPAENSSACFLILVAAEGCLGIATGGFFKTGSLISKHYNSFVTGNISLGIMITMLIVPIMVNGINEHNEQKEWRWIFIITACVLVGTNIIFALIGTAEPAYWTTDEFLSQQISKHLKNVEIGIQTTDCIEKGIEINGVRYGFSWQENEWVQVLPKASRNGSQKDRKGSCVF